VECLRERGEYMELGVECVAILCTVCYVLYYETLCLAASVFVPCAMVELRLCRGYAVACDALSRFVTFLCGTIPYACRGLYGAFMSFLKGVFRLGLVWGVKSLLTTVESLEGLW